MNIPKYYQYLTSKSVKEDKPFFSDMILTLGDSNDLGLSMIVAYRTMPMNNNNTKMSIIFHDQANHDSGNGQRLPQDTLIIIIE